jgi:hypothetical protein
VDVFEGVFSENAFRHSPRLSPPSKQTSHRPKKYKDDGHKGGSGEQSNQGLRH